MSLPTVGSVRKEQGLEKKLRSWPILRSPHFGSFFLLLRPGKGPRFPASLISDFSGRLLQNEGDHAICPVYLLNSSHERLEKNRATGLLRASQACGAEGRVDDVVSTAA